MSTRSRILVAVAAVLIVVGAAGMAVAQPTGGPADDDRPVTPGWMAGGGSGAGGMMAGAREMMAGAGGMTGVDADQMQAWMDEMHADDAEMQAWMDEMHADPERMLELHDEMHARYPAMQGMMEGLGGARGVDGSHCLGAAPTQ